MTRRLGRRTARIQIPVAPLASLSILVFGCVVGSGLFSAARGPGLRFATFDEAGGFSKERSIRVEIEGDGALTLEGATVSPERLGAAVAASLAQRPGAGVVLVVDADVPYRSMLAAYAAISGLPDPPRVALPPRSWVESPARARDRSRAQ